MSACLPQILLVLFRKDLSPEQIERRIRSTAPELTEWALAMAGANLYGIRVPVGREQEYAQRFRVSSDVVLVERMSRALETLTSH